MDVDIEPLIERIRKRYMRISPHPCRRTSFLAHLESLGRWEEDSAEGSKDPEMPEGMEFPQEVSVAYAVCECGTGEFIVDGSTQECQHCGSSMFRTEVKRYRLST